MQENTDQKNSVFGHYENCQGKDTNMLNVKNRNINQSTLYSLLVLQNMWSLGNLCHDTNTESGSYLH